MNTFIITGASKGLGAEIAKQCFHTENHCLLVSRSSNPDMEKLASEQGAKLTFIKADLSNTSEIPLLMDKLFLEVNEKSDSVCLINNAGLVEPIKTVGNLPHVSLEKSMDVNFLAPVILMDCFIKKTEGMECKKVIVNISSGAAKNPYQGWSVYCSTKAGLEMFTRVAGAEQETKDYPVKAISFSPGIMDTGMQKTIRSADSDDFSDSEKFRDYKTKGLLRKPEFVAQKLVHLIMNDELENGKFYDIKEFI
ncbi:(S)-benzoin forming benzil reductase [Bacillus massiliglaciei]|uniref:(S)-benzoin forming benzil reductase n=1 Tax=Bacillus massiliglaciei TaxID=1816693 RepID=UPI000ABB1066|nr:(S)-benzoin forming benzil reductase [Bacillus massiliglaciei]